MNVTQMLAELKWRLGNRTDIEPRTLTWLNDAYFELLLSPRFTFFETDRLHEWPTIAGTRVYDIVAMVPDLWFILDLRNETTQYKLKRYHWSEFDRKTRVLAMPSRYTRFGPTIELEPVPDKIYDMTMRYRVRPLELVDGTNHLLTREWDEVIITMAVQKGWEALEQWDKATAQKQIVETQLATREEPHSLEDADSETTIWPMRENW